MATTLEQHVALDETRVPSAQRLRIGRSNFRLPSDIQSKEPTLQVVYDVLRNSPFFKAFLVTTDVPEIYMQEFWATSKLHQHSIRFKMDTRKHVLDLEAFREMLHISPRIPSQSFAELPFEEEILEFLRDDVLFSTIKVVSRHQTTQQYDAILPIELTTDDIRNKLSWNSSDDEDVDEQTKGREESKGDKTDESDDDQDEAKKVDDDDDNEKEVPKIDEQETTESDEGHDEATESDRDGK
nr:hypothetical protein [Tanacetum cinerariifolium]